MNILYIYFWLVFDVSQNMLSYSSEGPKVLKHMLFNAHLTKKRVFFFENTYLRFSFLLFKICKKTKRRLPNPLKGGVNIIWVYYIENGVTSPSKFRLRSKFRLLYCPTWAAESVLNKPPRSVHCISYV